MHHDKRSASRLSPKQRVLKKFPFAMLSRASIGYDVRGSGSQLFDEMGHGMTPSAAWADAARRLHPAAVVERKLRYANKQRLQRTRKPR